MQLRSDKLGLEIHNFMSYKIYKNDSDSVIIVTDSDDKVAH